MSHPVVQPAPRGVYIRDARGPILPGVDEALVEIVDSSGRFLVRAFIPRDHDTPLLNEFADAWLVLHDPPVTIASRVLTRVFSLLK